MGKYYWFGLNHYSIQYSYYQNYNLQLGRRNGFTKRFLGFSLYVSNTTNISDGTLCYKDTSFTTDTIPAIFNTTCHTYGQYVICYNERLSVSTYPEGYSLYAWNEICEMEVFGKKRTFFFFILFFGICCLNLYSSDFIWIQLIYPHSILCVCVDFLDFISFDCLGFFPSIRYFFHSSGDLIITV